MITFTIKYNETENKADMKDTDSILDLKKIIIRNLELDTQYIDLDFKLERPIRALGKMNLEKGILPRTMDNFPFNRYNLEGKEIVCVPIPVKDYLPQVQAKNGNPQSIYTPPAMKNNGPKEYKNIATYNLDSTDDFPSL
mgnify:FL=1